MRNIFIMRTVVLLLLLTETELVINVNGEEFMLDTIISTASCLVDDQKNTKHNLRNQFYREFKNSEMQDPAKVVINSKYQIGSLWPRNFP